jgi:ribosomal protein S18 acetylase RimI-like enzyme
MLSVIEADLARPQHQTAVLELTRAYAQDPMGNGADLPEIVHGSLIEGLRGHPTTLIFLALDANRYVGISTCFLGFSTFASRRLINIHDLHVLAEYRGKGIARRLLQAVEAKARQLDCCKITLEVQENNRAALALYGSFGFVGGEYQAEAGALLFRQKILG